MIRILFMAVLLVSFQSLADDLKPLPVIETMGQDIFEQQSAIIKKQYDHNNLLNFNVRIPKNFIVKPDDQLINTKQDNRVYGEVFHAYTPTTYDLRATFSVQSHELDRLISGRNWFLSYALENNYSIRGIESKNDDKDFEVFYVRIDDFGRSEAVRSRGFLHENRVIIAEYSVPVKIFNQEKDKQIHVVQSFDFQQDYQIASPEKLLSYEYLDSFSVQYPQSWILTRKGMDSINRHDISFKTSDKNQFLLASVDVSVLSRRSLKDVVDKTIYPVDLASVINAKKENLASLKYISDPVLERINHADSLSYNALIAMTEIYPLRRKKSDTFIQELENPIINEFWLTVIKTDKTSDKNYILSMVAPSRDVDFYNWAVAKQAYDLMVKSAR